ncbi:NB-ARC domain-containing protein [Phormidesmis sp. 146-35]
MTIEEALIVLDSLLGRQRLTHLQETVFCRAWEGQTYEQIATTEGYDADYVKLVGSQLWQLISELVGQRVTKNNFRVVLRQRIGTSEPKELTPPSSFLPSPSSRSDSTYQDWGEVIDLSNFCGRSHELEILEQWATSSRLIAILGMGGMGKTVLSVKLAQRLQNQFEYVIWRSLRDAPTVETILSDLIQVLSQQQETELPDSVDGKLGRLMHYLRQHRCLLILDNVESILGTGEQAGHYPIGYEFYGDLFKRIGETLHRSCVVITSREKPREVVALEGMAIRSLKVTGLNSLETIELLKTKRLSATESVFGQLIEMYAGNPLALKIAATTIQDLFDGDVSEFLKHGTAVFGDISDLLDQQFDRLSDLEKQIMYWLTIDREGASLSDLAEDLVPPVPRRYLMEALASLARRPLVEKQGAKFTQQPVVMEYVTDRLIEQIYRELWADSIKSSKLPLFHTHALMKATVEDHVRESQVRMIVKPLLDRFLASHHKPEVERQLKHFLNRLRNQLEGTSGYGAGNIINLLNQSHSDLSDWDFSDLTIWQAYLQGIQLHRVNFANSDLSRSVFSETLGNVWSVAFSPNGTLLAASDTAGEIHIWRVSDPQGNLLQNRQKLITCHGHQHWVCSIAFSPDGKTLVSGSGDKTVKLWDVATGHCWQTLEGHTDWVISVAFSPTRSLVASSSSDRTIRLWNIHTGDCVQILEGHEHWICGIAFSPTGDLVSGSDDRTLKLWNIQTGECDRTLIGHQSVIRGVTVNANGSLIASGSEDQTIKLWDVKTGECLKTLVGHTSEVRSLAFHADGKTLVSSSFDRTLKLWDISTGKCLKTLQGHTEAVRSVAFSPNASLLASGSADQSIRLWNHQTGECLKTLQGYTNFVLSVAFSPDGGAIASTSANHTVKLWGVSSGDCLKTMYGHTNWVWSVAFSPDGQSLASGSFDQTIRLWSRQTGQCLKILRGHTNWVWSVAMSPDGILLASGSSDQTIRLWHTQTGDCLKVLATPSRIWTVTFSPDGQQLASGDEDHTIQLWDVHKGQCLKTLNGHQARICSVAFSADQHTLVSGSDDHTIRIWDVNTGKCLRVMHDRDCVKSAHFNTDETQIISSGFDHTVKFWNAQTGQCQQVLQGHEARIWSADYRRDRKETSNKVDRKEMSAEADRKEISAEADRSSKMPEALIASGSEDETIRLWDATSGECVRVLRNLRPYEAMNICGVTGLTEAQKATLRTLGATEQVT